MTELVPNLRTSTMVRWNTSEATVVADMTRAHPGVYLHMHRVDQRRIDDPAGLIAMLTAANQVMREHQATPPLNPEQEIAFRKDWDARVVPSPGTGGIRHPSGAPSIIGSRRRPAAGDLNEQPRDAPTHTAVSPEERARIAAIQASRSDDLGGHATYAFGQGSYDGDACINCHWQNEPGTAESHRLETGGQPRPTLTSVSDDRDFLLELVERLTAQLNEQTAL